MLERPEGREESGSHDRHEAEVVSKCGVVMVEE